MQVVVEDDKTVISKRPPVAETLLIPRASTPSEMGRILVGERLGHFQLEEFVGGGGMGAVFRATDTMLGRTVAVKVLSRDQTDEDTLRRFQLEAQNAARLDHERIARVYYVNEDKGWHYIVFEYIDGVNIRDLVDEHGPLPLDDAIYYTLQVTEALRHASRRDVVHRDIKPSNILVMADGRAKLVDMGLARRHQVDSSENDLTQSGVTLGTFDYISPEQAREPRNADVRSDIYSLGCTLYFMLTGRPPFPEGTVLQKLLSHSSDPPSDPRLYRPDIPDDICRVLMKMLAKNPGQRFQSPDELIGDLLRVADRLGLDRTRTSGAVWVGHIESHAPWYEKHLPWAAPVVTLVLVILALEWFTSAPNNDLVPPRPNLLSPVTALEGERKPTGPTIPIARKTNTEPATLTAPPLESPEPTVEVTPMPEPTGQAASKGADQGAESPGAPALPTKDPLPETTGNSKTTAKPVATRLLIVGPANTPHGPESQVVKSLSEACELAAELPGLEAIELHYDGERVEEPLEISLPSLTIRAGPERKPVVVFRPEVNRLAGDRGMLRLSGDRVKIQGVQFRLDLPIERGGDGWALFELTDIRSLDLELCALTIRNATSSGVMLQSGVSFLKIITEPFADLEDYFDPTFLRPEIILTKTIARGEAVLVQSEAGTPFKLQWEQGLFASTERLIEVGGTISNAPFDTTALAEIDLNRVTLAARSGLSLFGSHMDAPYHMAMKVKATACILLVDPSSPLFEHRTLQPFDLLKREPPQFEAIGVCLPGVKDYWRIVPQRTADSVDVPVQITLDEAREFGLKESGLYRASVIWKGLPTSARPVHTHLVADYLLSDEPNNPALKRGEVAAGFNAAVLREFLPEAAPTPPAPPPVSEVRSEPTPGGSTMSEKMKMIMTPNGTSRSPTDELEPE